MKFRVQRDVLFRNLQKVQAIAERRSEPPILQYVLLRTTPGEREGKGSLLLNATDSEVMVEAILPAEVEEEGTAALHARKLFEIVRHLPDNEVDFSFKDSRVMAIRCGRSRFQIPGGEVDQFPRITPVPDSDPIRIDFPTFRNMVQRVVFATTEEDTRFVYRGAQMLVQEGILEFAATDGHRLAVVRADSKYWLAGERGPGREIKVILPKKALFSLERAEDEEEKVLEFWDTDEKLFFRSGSWILTSSKVSGSFAPYEKVIPVGNDLAVQVRTQELLNSVRRVEVISLEKSKPVQFALRPGKLELITREQKSGEEAWDEIDVEYDGKPIQIGFNSHYLSDFLSAVGSEWLRIQLKDPQAAGLFRPAEENPVLKYTYVVMPMSFGKEEEGTPETAAQRAS